MTDVEQAQELEQPQETMDDGHSVHAASAPDTEGDGATPEPVSPDSQGAINRRPVTETAERFLRAILAEIPVSHVEALYLFRPLRQGQVETGVAVVAAAPPEDPAHRHTVHTARYRLVVKGPDRGRWEYECVAEADAPLLTIETVVRGVQQRSGDDAEPVVYDAASLAHVLSLVLTDAPSP